MEHSADLSSAASAGLHGGSKPVLPRRWSRRRSVRPSRDRRLCRQQHALQRPGWVVRPLPVSALTAAAGAWASRGEAADGPAASPTTRECVARTERTVARTRPASAAPARRTTAARCPVEVWWPWRPLSWNRLRCAVMRAPTTARSHEPAGTGAPSSRARVLSKAEPRRSAGRPAPTR